MGTLLERDKPGARREASAGTSGSRTPLALTPSRVRDYVICAARYDLRLRHGSDSAASPSLSFGASLHAALEELHTRPPDAATADATRRTLERYWRAGGYADESEAERQFERGAAALARYWREMSRPRGVILGTEVYLSHLLRVRGTPVRLGCKADRLELYPDGVLEVLDYKTDARGQVPTAEALATDLPTFLYYVLARLAYPEHGRVRVAQLNVLSLARAEVEYTPERLAANKQKLIELIGEMTAGVFAPRAGEACAWCPVRDVCPAQSAVADLDAV